MSWAMFSYIMLRMSRPIMLLFIVLRPIMLSFIMLLFIMLRPIMLLFIMLPPIMFLFFTFSLIMSWPIMLEDLSIMPYMLRLEDISFIWCLCIMLFGVILEGGGIHEGGHPGPDEVRLDGALDPVLRPAAVSIVLEDVEPRIVGNVVHTSQYTIAHDVSVLPPDGHIIALLYLLGVLIGIGIFKVAKLILEVVLT